MSDDNFAADPDALRNSSKRILALQSRIDRLAHEINNIVTNYPDAAGDGDYREQFDQKYVPTANSANEYMKWLAEAVGDFGSGTSSAANVFQAADDNATTNSTRR